MNKFDKKIIILIVFIALFSGIIGSLSSAEFAKADAFDSLKNFFKPLLPQVFTPKESAQENNQEKTAPSISEQIKEIQKQEVPLYKPAIDYENAIVEAVENASPAVVSIIISKDVPVLEQCPSNPFSDLPSEFQDFFGFPGGGFQFYQPCQKGVEKKEIGGGTGFVISSDGLILTNKHVASDKKASYTVLTNDGKKYDAEILAQDQVMDIAVVKIKANNLPVLKFGNSDSVKLGQTAIAIGNALGEFRNTVSVGVVSGLARTITASGGGQTETIEGVLQTDTAINQGNSGGPLLNLKGEVIGINTAMVSGAQNIGFAIPINKAKRAIESVKTTGRIITPFLGVRYILISPELAKKEELAIDYGVLVRGGQDGPAVVKKSSAEKAGIQAEDIILEINSKKISQNNTLSSIIQDYNVGDTINLKILRNGKEIEIKVRLEERKE